MKEILEQIRHADDIEINEIIDAVILRYKDAFPGWEVMFLSLPRNNPDACLKRLEEIAAFIRNHRYEIENAEGQ